MNPVDFAGTRLPDAVRAALPAGADRSELYRALLDEPLCLAHLGPGAPPGPALRLEDGESTRLVESIVLGVPVVALFAELRAMQHAARERHLWPDGVERARVLERGAAFPLLRAQPGAAVMVEDGQLALDAGEVGALADRQSPTEFVASLRASIAAGRGFEAARRLQKRVLYVLGHPGGGMVVLQRELPAFLHLWQAEGFATRWGQSLGRKPQHALVAAAELFRFAVRGKLMVVLDPGPQALRLRSVDLR